MAGVLTVKTLLLTGFVLLIIGADRLLNAYLLGAGSSSQVRVIFGTVCMIAGSLIALTAYVTSRTRR